MRSNLLSLGGQFFTKDEWSTLSNNEIDGDVNVVHDRAASSGDASVTSSGCSLDAIDSWFTLFLLLNR